MNSELSHQTAVTDRVTKILQEDPQTADAAISMSYKTYIDEKLHLNTNNLLFVGNSLVYGMELHSESNSTFLTKGGISLEGLRDEIYEKLTEQSCETVLIGMGTNELSWYSEPRFKASYLELIYHIFNINPEATVICLSIPPVSQEKSDSSEYFNNPNIQKFNGWIQEICDSNNQVLYFDNGLYFGDVLSSDLTSDGIHLGPTTYKDWYDFIVAEIATW